MVRFFLLMIFCHVLLTLHAQKASRLHKKSIIVDTHNDMLTSQTLEGRDVSHHLHEGHSDLPRLKDGGVDVQFFSVWTGTQARNAGGFFHDALEQIDSLEFIALRNEDKMTLTSNASDIKKILRQNKIAGIIGVEGGHMIEDDLAKLDSLYQRGMHYLTLTHNNSTSWASSAMDEVQQPGNLPQAGLNDFGKSVVNRLNELGVMIDLSHVGEKTFYDVLAITTKPVILSHSSVYTLAPHFRNVKDDQIKAVAKNNGVICINFYSAFIDSAFNNRYEYLNGEGGRSLRDSIEALYTNREEQRKQWRSYVNKVLEQLRPSYTRIADHIDYIVKLVGVDYVGIGADLDGVTSLPVGFDDATDYPKLTEELLRRGYTSSQIKKIWGKNVLRVMKAQKK